MQPEPDLTRVTLSIMALLESVPGGRNHQRTIDAAPRVALPPPDPDDVERRRREAVLTGKPLRSALGTVDEQPSVNEGQMQQPRRPPREDLIDLKDAREVKKAFERIAGISRSWPP
jgi:hypothetical protein